MIKYCPETVKELLPSMITEAHQTVNKVTEAEKHAIDDLKILLVFVEKCKVLFKQDHILRLSSFVAKIEMEEHLFYKN